MSGVQTGAASTEMVAELAEWVGRDGRASTRPLVPGLKARPIDSTDRKEPPRLMMTHAVPALSRRNAAQSRRVAQAVR